MGEGAKRVRAGFEGSRFGIGACLDLVESKRHELHSQCVLMPLTGFESSIESRKDNHKHKLKTINTYIVFTNAGTLQLTCKYKYG